MHLDENLEVIAWQVGDLVHRKRQLHLQKSGLYCSLFNFKSNKTVAKEIKKTICYV